MNCAEIRTLIDAYLDGELDPLMSQKVDQHLRECRQCEQAYHLESAMAHAIRETAPYYKAPTELRERIQSSLRQTSGETTNRGAVEPDSVKRAEVIRRGAFSGMSWNWLALAAAIVVAAVIGITVLPRLKQSDSAQFLTTQLIDSHVRSLMADHLTDVASSDQHTVKPWLDMKLDFAAPVVDLSKDGFPLVGGRLDYLDKHAAAALVYQRRKHFINLFIWPTSPGDNKTQTMVERDGYHLLRWGDSDFTYWAVSDVNVGDLENFKQLFEQQTEHH